MRSPQTIIYDRGAPHPYLLALRYPRASAYSRPKASASDAEWKQVLTRIPNRMEIRIVVADREFYPEKNGLRGYKHKTFPLPSASSS